MFPRFLFVIAFIGLAAAPAWADSSAKPDDDQTVPLSPVALPIVVDGQVLNYVFVTAKVLLTPRADQLSLRDKEPFFRDALVRDAHRTPFVLPHDFNKIDEGKLKAALFRDAVAIAGAANIRGI
ncbi:MAG TPA: hypothetical protein VJP88_01435, partial [Caulobacteraceae bacterium]|nr:hypothetical protein [Caulobacteraceae bacterium]